MIQTPEQDEVKTRVIEMFGEDTVRYIDLRWAELHDCRLGGMTTLCGKLPTDADCSYCLTPGECRDQQEATYLRNLVDRPDLGELRKGDWC